MKPDLFAGHDLIFLAYPESSSVDQTKIKLRNKQEQLKSLFKKAGLLK